MQAGGVRLVVGLGNPGSRYAGTRHNVGFRAVDRFVEEAEGGWSAAPLGKGLAAKVRLAAGRSLWAAKPHTFMNVSGSMVAPLARYFKIEGGEVLVVSDDFELPLGRIRIRVRGSCGGQKGLESILSCFGTLEVPRLRLGVGPRPPQVPGADFVLGRFRAEEAEPLDEMLKRASAAIRVVCEEGLEAAMNAYNHRIE
ncbi:MAG: aminoacyl-tRNA hydrolase [Elusimicrobiota bacterium]